MTMATRDTTDPRTGETIRQVFTPMRDRVGLGKTDLAILMADLSQEIGELTRQADDALARIGRLQQLQRVLVIIRDDSATVPSTTEL